MLAHMIGEHPPFERRKSLDLQIDTKMKQGTSGRSSMSSLYSYVRCFRQEYGLSRDQHRIAASIQLTTGIIDQCAPSPSGPFRRSPVVEKGVITIFGHQRAQLMSAPN